MTSTRERYTDENVMRCFCAHAPILGIIKFDKQSRPFVHIKVYKQSRIYGEILLKVGEMRVRCRECYRWHTIKIVHEKPVLEDVPEGEDIVDSISDPF